MDVSDRGHVGRVIGMARRGSLGRDVLGVAGPSGLSSSTSPVGQPGPEGCFSQPRIGRTMFSAAIGVPL